MEKTESVVIQVSPSGENRKIKEMQTFGWNLQGSQEIQEIGDAYVYDSDGPSKYTIETTTHHYVKLHFVRSLNLPNLQQIKEIEKEYASLPFPSEPSFAGWFVIVCSALVGLMSFIAVKRVRNEAEVVVLMVLFAVCVVAIVLGIVWLWQDMREAEKVHTISRRSHDRAKELLNEARKIL